MSDFVKFHTEGEWREFVAEQTRKGIWTPRDYCPYGCGGAGMFRRDVSVDDPDFGKPIPCQCALEKRKHLGTARYEEQRSTMPPEQRAASFRNYKGDVNAAIAAEMAVSALNSIYVFWGDYGVGKTWLLSAIANECMKRNVPARYCIVPDMLDELRAAIRNDTFEREFKELRMVKVLLLDEFHRYYDKARFGGDGDGVGWAAEKMFELLNYRYDHYHELLTVVATNKNPTEGHDALSSRLSHTTRCRVIEVGVNEGDLRPTAHTLKVEPEDDTEHDADDD